MQEIQKEYNNLLASNKKLAKLIKKKLQRILERLSVKGVEITTRVKTFKSFWKKLKKGQNQGKYKKPFQDIEDLCGIRVICLYNSEIDKVAKVINQNFNVSKEEDKSEELGIKEVGYRSRHFIVTIKEKWLSLPDDNVFANMKAEIQLRTLCMHAWAAPEHSLRYKTGKRLSKELQRRLTLLSATLELADEQFELLKKEQDRFWEKLQKDATKSNPFKENFELNYENLCILLIKYFPVSLVAEENIDDILKKILEKIGSSVLEVTRLMSSLEEIKDTFSHLQKKKHFDDFDLENFILDIVGKQVTIIHSTTITAPD